VTGSARLDAHSKTEAAYWRGRLFKNTFTYKGRRLEVKGWSAKIQLFGRRKTFSLSSSDRTRAAEEACRIYQTILTHGWKSVVDRRTTGELVNSGKAGEPTPSTSTASDLENWTGRLIHRKHLDESPVSADRNFSARIVHARESWFFPLGTSDETKAAARAQRIHQTVVTRGWEFAHRRYPRELTLALRWLDDPVAWTYITIHTQPRQAPQSVCDRSASPSPLSVVLVEPDAGIRRALVACINSQEGFRCHFAFPRAAEAIRESSVRQLDFALVNHTLVHQPGMVCLDEWHRIKPGFVGILYSVFEDSDQLFKATPGGAMGYLLKRTTPSRIFDPIAGATRPLIREQIAAHVRGYFQRLSASLPAGPPSRELATLTPREHEILGLLSKGQLAKEIADTLGISTWTVHGHVKSIFEKLNVHTRTEAVVKFLQK